MTALLMPQDVDRILRYPSGRSERLAKEGKISFIRLPDGSIRFDEEQIKTLLAAHRIPEVSNAD
jgi:predicted site-specific integrase-resolvase